MFEESDQNRRTDFKPLLLCIELGNGTLTEVALSGPEQFWVVLNPLNFLVHLLDGRWLTFYGSRELYDRKIRQGAFLSPKQAHEWLMRNEQDVPEELILSMVERKDEPYIKPPIQGFLGGMELANELGVDPSQREAFFAQLKRKRSELGDKNYVESSNPLPNIPTFYYRIDSPAVIALAAEYKQPKLS